MINLKQALLTNKLAQFIKKRSYLSAPTDKFNTILNSMALQNSTKARQSSVQDETAD
jgi:hypothetical protein